MNWIQEQVYAIGWLVIIGGAIYLLFRFLTKKEDIKKENEILRKYSDECQKIDRDWESYKRFHPSVPPNETSIELNKWASDVYTLTEKDKENYRKEWQKKKKEHDDAIIAALNNPAERANAREKYWNEQNIKEQSKINKRKVGYKYEIEIYEIFEKFEKNEMYQHNEIFPVKGPTKEDMLYAIKSHFLVDNEKAKSILQIWINNQLVVGWRDGPYSIGLVLAFNNKYRHDYKITDTDLTYDQWKAIKKYKKDILNVFDGKDEIPSSGEPLFEEGKYIGIKNNGIIDVIQEYYSISQEKACDILYHNWLEYDLVCGIKGSYSIDKAYKISDFLRANISII